jgi:AraC-like DNA-binding protein
MLVPQQAVIAHDCEVLLIENLAHLAHSEFLGVELGLAHNPRCGSLLVYMLFTSATIGDALENLSHFVPIVRPHASLGITRAPDTVTLSIDASGARFNTASHYVEFTVAMLLKSLSLASGRNRIAKSVNLAGPRRTGAAELSQLLECPVQLAAPETQILFDPDTLDFPILSADDALLAHLNSYGSLLLEYRENTPADLASEVQLRILEQLRRGNVTRQATATAMGVSERTLARRLAEAGHSFREITEKARQQLARTYLADPALAIAEIAFLLGYVDQSSFSAAFRRWTGMSPARFRQDLAQRYEENEALS